MRDREAEGAEGDGIFTEAGEMEGWGWEEGGHDVSGEGGVYRAPQRFADHREAAAEDEGAGVEEVDDVGEGEGEVVSEVGEDLLCELVALAQRFGEGFGFSSTHFGCESREEGGTAVAFVADAGVDGPAGAAGFDGGAVAVESEVAELALAGRGAVVDAAVDGKAAADAAAEVEVDEWGGVGFGGEGLTEGGDVGVVLDDDRGAGDVVQPVAKGEVVPAADLVGDGGAAGEVVDGATEADGDAGDRVVGEFGAESVLELVADAVGAAVAVGGGAPAVEDGRGGVALDDLKLGAADLDAKVGGVVGHAGGMLPRAGRTLTIPG